MLHRDPPKRIRHGAHKNDRGKDRAEVFDHELEDAIIGDEMYYRLLNHFEQALEMKHY